MIIEGIKISGVTSNSRKVKKDYAFVAISGENQDGNDFIEDAVKRGARIVYTEQEVYRKDCIIIKVNDARKELATLCNKFYDYPSRKLHVVGVTGTNGKTTITNLIYHILKDAGVKAGLIGTLFIKIGEDQYPSKLTTPDVEDIYYYLNKMVDEKVEVVVLEASSHGLKSDRLYQVEFDIAIHTNINWDHMNFHKNITDYINSKKKLFDSLAPGKIAIVNHDDEYGKKMLEGNNRILVITYGLNSKATVNASSIDSDFTTSFNYCLQRGITTLGGAELEPFEYPIVYNLIGNHNIYNSLSAISTCLLLDVPIDKIARALKKYPAVIRRLEVIYNEDFKVIDDYCHNPSSYDAVFRAMQNLHYRNLYIVNGIRGDRGIEINKKNAETIKQWYEILNVKNLIITDSIDCVDNGNKVHGNERSVYFKIFHEGNIQFKYERTLRGAIDEGLKDVGKGDIVLLLGAQSMDRGKEIFLKLMENRENVNLNEHDCSKNIGVSTNNKILY